MKWILILGIPWGSAMNVNGISATTGVFEDERACVAALDRAKRVKNWQRPADVEGFCVPSATAGEAGKTGE